MSMEIDRFRSITEQSVLENRRVTVDRDEGTITAPNSLWGRYVHWRKEKLGQGVGDVRAQQNINTRETFYKALEKAYGTEIANNAIVRMTSHFSEDGFKTNRQNLTAFKIKQIIDFADKEYAGHKAQIEGKINDFINTKSLARMANESNRVHSEFDAFLPPPQQHRTDPDLTNAFRMVVRSHPDYGRRDFTDKEMSDLAGKAIDQMIKVKEERLKNEFPSLSELDKGHFKDVWTYFDNLRKDTRTPPLSDPHFKDFGSWVNTSLSALENTTKTLSESHFDRDTVDRLLSQNDPSSLQRRHNELVALRDRVTLDPVGQKRIVFENVCSRVLGENHRIPGLNEQQRNYLDRQMNNTGWVTIRMNDFTGQNRSLDNPAHRDALINDLGGDFRQQLDYFHNLSPEQKDTLRDAYVQDLNARFAEAAEEFAMCENPPQQVLELQQAIKDEIDHQLGKLQAKKEVLEAYVKGDPLSAKNVAYGKLVWAQTAMKALEDIRDGQQAKIEDLQRRVNELNEQIQQLEGQHNDDENANIRPQLQLAWRNMVESRDRLDAERIQLQIYRARTNDIINVHQNTLDQYQQRWEQAGNERVDPKNTRENPSINMVRRDMISLVRDAKNRVHFDLRMRTEDFMFKEYKKTLETVPEWNTISREIVAYREGSTRGFRSELIPGSKIGGAVTVGYTQDNLQGVVGTDQSQINHVSNLQVSRLYEIDLEKQEGEEERRIKGDPLMQTIHHGVVNGYEIEDPEQRLQARENGVGEILNTVVEIHPRFKQRAIEKQHPQNQNGNVGNDNQNGNVENPNDGPFILNLEELDPPINQNINPNQNVNQDDPEVLPRSRIVHINLNLSPSDAPEQRKNNREFKTVEFQNAQFWAFNQWNGTNTLKVDTQQNPEGDPNVQDLEFDIETITFSFSVSEQKKGTLTPSSRGWDQVEQHDRENLIKLVGDLNTNTNPGGEIGKVMDTLQAKIEETRQDQDLNEDQRKEQIDQLQRHMRLIREEVDAVREMFNSGTYNTVTSDGYKIARHIEHVVHLSERGLQLAGDDDNVFSISTGCTTSMHRGGISDVEIKTQTIIEHMGGGVNPGGVYDGEDSIIFNQVLTGSGQLEAQRQNTGVGGTHTVEELKDSIQDQEVMDYMTGLDRFRRRM